MNNKRYFLIPAAESSYIQFLFSLFSTYYLGLILWNINLIT